MIRASEMNSYEIIKRSPFSGNFNTMYIEMTQEQYEELFESDRGRAIQNIVPHLSPDEREFIMTGITPDEWGDAFGEDDE